MNAELIQKVKDIGYQVIENPDGDEGSLRIAGHSTDVIVAKDDDDALEALYDAVSEPDSAPADEA